ncbi:MAG: YhdP family protein [Neptuniibacter sp.]
MKRLAHSLAWYLYWVLAIFLALIAVLLISFKLFFEDLGSYRAEVQTLLSERLQARVLLGDINGSWNGWRPNLQVDSLVIEQMQDQPGFSASVVKAHIEIDPAQSLTVFQPVFSVFDFEGLKVRYDLSSQPQRQESEEISQQKASSNHPVSDAGADLLTLLLHQSDINLAKTQIEFVARNGEVISIAPIQLKMQHDGAMHQLLVNADLVTQAGNTSLSFVAEVEGTPSRDDVNFYLSIDQLDHELLNPWLKLTDLALDNFEGTQRVWGKVQKGKLTYLTSETSVKNFKYQQYELEEFTLHTALLRRDRSYQLQLTDFYVSGADKRFNLPRISLDLVRSGSSIEPKVLMVDKIDLELLQNWLSEQPFLPGETGSILNTFAPVGTLENIQVTWKDPKDLTSFQLAADLSRVGINAWNDVPELKGINGLLTANIDGGKIHLVSSDFLMAYPTLFADRWQYSGAQGVIGWRFEDKGVVVASELLNLSDEYVSAAGRFSIYLPFSRDEQPLLNLQIGMQSSDGTQARYYIPPREVGEKTYEWLVAAIKEGHIKQAGFILNGVTRSRLSDYQLPVVQMFFNLSDASFAYQPGWPEIKKADAFVFFRNGELIAEAKGGQLYDSDIDFAWVHLPNTKDKLFVTGEVNGLASDLRKVLTESPLREEVGEDLNDWSMTGSANTLLDIEIPLYNQKQPRVTVQSFIKGGGFESKQDRISFTDINGLVSYRSATGLGAEELTATLFDQPVKARISSSKSKTQVYLDSAIDTDSLRKWLDLDLLAIMSGTLKYNARLDMCPGKSCNQLVIGSDLKGVEIDAPSPLGKLADQKGQLSLVSDLGRGFKDGRSAVRLNFANQLRGVMIMNDQQVDRARFHLGGNRPKVPEQPGIWLDGKVAYLDYDQLERFMDEAGFTGDDPKNSTNAEQSENILKSVNLNIDQFVFDEIYLEDLSVQLTPAKEGWNLQASGPELAGSLFIPDSQNSIYNVDLDYLVLNTPDNEDKLEEPIPEAPVKAEDLPFVNFSVKQLTLNEKPMGQWSFELVPIVNGVIVENIKADFQGASAKGEVRWKDDNDQRSHLTLRLDGDDFGKVLDAWGMSKFLETKSLKSYLQLSWDGAPWEFSIAKADGEVQFTANKGRLLDVGNAGNFLRVFGILNLQSLGRRLRLDFSDLFESGVAFDEMKANYEIQKGVATTTEPFVMVGPSVNMAMQGSLDLDKETVDKDIEVAIPVTGNIPLVSVLLGAPQVAGAVFLFDKLIGDPLAKFSTVKYHMSGDWSDPKIDVYNAKEEQQNQVDDLELGNG